VKNGILNLTSQMFGVSYKKVDEPVWHSSVDVYEMWDDEKLLGRFYLDMHPRENKYKHAMLTEVRTGVRGIQVPEAALVCNFPGGDGSTGLMEHQQVKTFFHEFGHLLHYIFGGHQPWIKISGISTEWDFVETPSILLEEWVWDAAILKKFAVNASGEPIPDNLIEKMNAARTFGLGLNVLQQMYYSAISLNFYNRAPHSFDLLEMVKSLQHEITPFEYVDGTFMHLAFGHLDGYSAIYYTYKWSEVIAKDMFSLFQQEGLLNEKLAQKYRKTVLEPGGSKEANKLIIDFLGRDFSFEAFANWLNN
jgi:thimet oligopeptidase